MKKRKGVVFGALCLALCLAAGCASDVQVKEPAQSESSEESVDLRFLHIWDEHGDTMEKIVRSIEQENEGMRIHIKTVSWENLENEISTAHAADEMYDVFYQYASEVNDMQAQGMLLNLDAYMDDAWKARFYDSALEEYSINGEIYGLPYRGNGVVVVYDRDLFKRKGWNVPKTQDELVSLMQEIQAEGLIPMTMAGRPDGFQLETLRDIVTDYIAQDAGMLDDPERLNGRKADWQGELAMGARTVKSWASKEFFGTNPLSVDQMTAMDRFLSGKAAMLLCNTNELYQLRNQGSYLPFEMSSFLFPAIHEDHEQLFSHASFQDGFAIYSGTQYPEQAVALLKGLTDEQYGSVWANETLSVMPLKNISAEDELLGEFSEYFAIAGRHGVKPDYALGDSESLKSQLFVDYLTSNMTADAFETNYETIVKNAVSAAEK